MTRTPADSSWPFTRQLLLVLALVSAPAFAHTGAGEPSGFVHGLLHPVGGWDHVLAMAGVGLFAWMLKGRALWALPLTFVAVMALGAVAAAYRLPVPLIEAGIALSVLGTGVLLARGRAMPVALALPLIALFAVFHGQAHGNEMPDSASGLAYGLGFVLATALLHGIGLLAGFGLARIAHSRALVIARAGGVAMAAAGALLLVVALTI